MDFGRMSVISAKSFAKKARMSIFERITLQEVLLGALHEAYQR
jgi:hypothetical protein